MPVLFFAVVVGGLVQPPATLIKRSRSYGTRVFAEENAQDMLEQAAKLRAEVAEAEASAPPRPATDARADIIAALKRATQLRDKEQLQITLTAAEQAGFSGSDEVVRNAVIAYNELTVLSDTMRSRLLSEAASQGGDPASGTWNPGFAYLGIFAVVGVLVVLGGKDIFY